ncbi:MAG: hypothetical protein AB7P17_03900 [Nitrospirales bacterium]
MVRTVLYVCIFLGIVCGWGSGAFGETSLIPNQWFTQSPTGLCRNTAHTPTGSSLMLMSSAADCQHAEEDEFPSTIHFSAKQDPFNLQAAGNMPSLVKQGGSRIVQASNDIPLMARHLTAGLHMAYRDPFLRSENAPSATNRMGAQFVLKGDWDSVRYQAEYGFAGQEAGTLPLSTPSGQMGGKMLWEWKLPLVTPKIELSRFSDNVDSDPLRARTIASKQTFSLNWALPEGSQLSLSYGREQRDVFTQPDGPLAESITTDSALAKLSLGHPIGTGFWSTRYRTYKDTLGEENLHQEMGSTMGGTFHLSNPIDVVPEWGFLRHTSSQEGPIEDRFFGNIGTVLRLTSTQEIKPRIEFQRNNNHQATERTDAFSAKLDYSFKAWNDSLRIAMSGKYVVKQTSLNNTDPQTCDVALLVHTDLHPLFRLPHRQQTLSLKVSHNQRIDTISSPTPPAQTTAMLLVSIAP